MSVLPHILGNFSSYFSTPPFLPCLCAGPYRLLLHPSPDLLVLWSLLCYHCAVTWQLLVSVKPWDVRRHCRSFRGSAWCGGSSPTVSRAFTGTVCPVQPLLTYWLWTPSAFLGGERLSLATRKRGLALLQLSCFFNFSPGEVVLMKYKIFSQNKTSRNWNYNNYNSWVTPLAEAPSSTAFSAGVHFCSADSVHSSLYSVVATNIFHVVTIFIIITLTEK